VFVRCYTDWWVSGCSWGGLTFSGVFHGYISLVKQRQNPEAKAIHHAIDKPRYFNTTGGLRKQLRSALYWLILTLKSCVFCDITPCDPVKIKQRFGETCRLHFHGRKEANQETTVKQEASFLIPNNCRLPVNIHFNIFCLLASSLEHEDKICKSLI
jgi:hypothetical protein